MQVAPHRLLLVILGLSLSALGQIGPTESTTVYQFSHFSASGGGSSGSTNVPAGASTSINVPVLPWFGIVGDVGWMQKSASATVGSVGAVGTGRLVTYGGGPQFTYRGKDRSIQPFGRFVLGGVRASADVSVAISGYGGFSSSGTTTAFFIAPGGGADFRLTPHVWLRGGADYFHADKNGVSLDGVRVFGGVQFRFGGRTASSAVGQATVEHASPAESVSVPALGVVVVPRSTGAEIVEVMSGQLANLRVGYVIVSVDEQKVSSPAELVAQLQSRQSSSQVHIGYLFRTSALGVLRGDTVATLK